MQKRNGGIIMTYKGFCAAVERKCERDGININFLDKDFLYQEFERMQEWGPVEKLIVENAHYLKNVA